MDCLRFVYYGKHAYLPTPANMGPGRFLCAETLEWHTEEPDVDEQGPTSLAERLLGPGVTAQEKLVAGLLAKGGKVVRAGPCARYFLVPIDSPEPAEPGWPVFQPAATPPPTPRPTHATPNVVELDDDPVPPPHATPNVVELDDDPVPPPHATPNVVELDDDPVPPPHATPNVVELDDDPVPPPHATPNVVELDDDPVPSPYAVLPACDGAPSPERGDALVPDAAHRAEAESIARYGPLVWLVCLKIQACVVTEELQAELVDALRRMLTGTSYLRLPALDDDFPDRIKAIARAPSWEWPCHRPADARRGDKYERSLVIKYLCSMCSRAELLAAVRACKDGVGA